MTPPDPVPQGLFVADLCDTLFQANTTFAYVAFVLQRTRHRARSWVLRAVTDRRSPVALLCVALYRFLGVDLPRPLCLRQLAGFSRSELSACAERFFDEILVPRAVAATQELLRGAQREGMRTLIVSASIDPVVDVVARRLGAEGLSSRLDFRAEVCTGRLADDLTGVKDARVRAMLPPGAVLTVVTDNLSDRALMHLATRRIAVIRDEGARSAWRELEPEFLVVPRSSRSGRS